MEDSDEVRDYAIFSKGRKIFITKKVADLVVSVADRFILYRFTELLGKVDRNPHATELFVSPHTQGLRINNITEFYYLSIHYQQKFINMKAACAEGMDT